MNKKIIIITLSIIVVLMTVGYAVFSTSLNITGTANIVSTWNIEFTKIEKQSTVGGVTETKTPTASGTTATFNVDFKSPGDKIIYEITVENKGTLNAIVKEISASETGSDGIYFKISGIKKGDKLPSKSNQIITVEIGYSSEVTTQPGDLRNDLTLNVTFVQDVGQNIPSEDLNIEGPILTQVTGKNNITFEDSSGRSLDNYIIYGNSIQNGTPTPDNPIPIQSFGDDEKIIISSYNKNLIAIPNLTDVSFSNSYYKDIATNYQLKTNTTYTLSYNINVISNPNNISLCAGIGYGNKGAYSADISWADAIKSNGRNAITFTTPNSFKNGGYLAIRFARTCDTSLSTISANVSNVQLELGGVATTYESHYEETINLAGHEPLRKVGGTADYIDFENKRIVRFIKTIEFDGSEKWNDFADRHTTKTIGVYYMNPDVLGVYQHSMFNGYVALSTHFINSSVTSYEMDDMLRVCLIDYSRDPYISFRIPYLTLAEWKNYLKEQKDKGTPVTVYYVLVNPIYEPIELPNIKTLKGANNFTIESNIPPNMVTLKYYKNRE